MLTENIKNWLSNNTHFYPGRLRVLNDVSQCILTHRLSPKTDYYFYGSVRVLLLCLSGVWNGIELQIWIPIDYPVVCPILIAKNRQVQEFKNCFRMLSEWNPQLDLVSLLFALLSDIGAKGPPLPQRPPRITGALNAQLEFKQLNPSHNLPIPQVAGGIKVVSTPVSKKEIQIIRNRADLLEKINSKQELLLSQLSIQTKLNSNLNTNRANLKEMKQQLEQVLNVCTRNVSVIQSRIGDLQSEIVSLQRKPDFQPSNITASNALTQQYEVLTRLVEEVVGVCVLNDIIKVETNRFNAAGEGYSGYLKKIRKESRQLFMKQVLIRKILKALKK